MFFFQLSQPATWLATALPALIGALVGGIATGFATWLGVRLTAKAQQRAVAEGNRRDLIIQLADAAEDVADVLNPRLNELDAKALLEAHRQLRRLVRRVIAYYRDDKAAGPFVQWLAPLWANLTAMADGTNEHFGASREARGTAARYATTMAQEATRWLTRSPAKWTAPAIKQTADVESPAEPTGPAGRDEPNL